MGQIRQLQTLLAQSHVPRQLPENQHKTNIDQLLKDNSSKQLKIEKLQTALREKTDYSESSRSLLVSCLDELDQLKSELQMERESSASLSKTNKEFASENEKLQNSLDELEGDKAKL